MNYAKASRSVAIVYTVLAVFSFLLMCTYNAWSPGYGFTGPANDPFEQKLIMLWVVWGFLGTCAVWVAVFCLQLYEINKDDE